MLLNPVPPPYDALEWETKPWGRDRLTQPLIQARRRFLAASRHALRQASR